MRWSRLSVASAALIFISPALVARADESLRVRLASGREFVAYIDSRTSEDTLWLRFGAGALAIRRPVAWSAVEWASAGDRPLNLEQLRRDPSAWLYKEADGPGRPQPPRAATPAPSTISPEPRRKAIEELPAPAGWAPPVIPASYSAVPGHGPAQSIVLDAGLANWNASVEADGLMVNVAALDEFGVPVKARGTLEVELYGVGPGGLTAMRSFPTLGRWVRAVELDPADPVTQFAKLDFQAVHPEFNTRVAPWGMVHARLTVPGQGVFDASTGATRVRAANPIRDRLEQTYNRRFFPNENTGRGQVTTSWFQVR